MRDNWNTWETCNWSKVTLICFIGNLYQNYYWTQIVVLFTRPNWANLSWVKDFHVGPHLLVKRAIQARAKWVAKGADVAKWIKAMDCGSIMHRFNPRCSPIQLVTELVLIAWNMLMELPNTSSQCKNLDEIKRITRSRIIGHFSS